MRPLGISFLSRKAFGRIFAFVTPLAVVLLAYSVLQGDHQILLIFALLTLVFSICRFDSRIPIIYAILLLVLAAVLTSQKADDTVNQLVVLIYWLLVVGIICMLIDLHRRKEPIQTGA
jgi:hypothetical protein